MICASGKNHTKCTSWENEELLTVKQLIRVVTTGRSQVSKSL
jgi:hypothetical protein